MTIPTQKRTPATAAAGKRPTLKDVAGKAGVSTSTVSNVINDRLGAVSRSTERRVRQAMKDLHYFPNSSARALRSNELGTFAFLVIDDAERYLADPLTNFIMAGIGDVLREQGWSLLVHTARGNDPLERLFRPLLDRSVDGAFVLLSGEPADRCRYLSELTKLPQPILVFDEILTDEAMLSVRAADRDAGRLVTEHLLDKGHKRIAFIAARVATAVREQRHLGYLDALRASGLAVDPELSVFYGGWQPDSGARMLTTLAQLPDPPTAVICGHDVLAIGALRAARERNLKVPEELAVAGFDDYAISAWLTPALTSVQLPGYQMGRVAASLLLETRAGNEPDARQVVLPVTLNLREST